MSNEATSGQESDGRIDLEITVCENGVVNIHRPESDRAHSVILGVLGDVVHCSCKGYKFRGDCSHTDAIERRPLVVSSALAAAATYHDPADPEPTADADAPRAVADGGRIESTENTPDDGDETDDLPAIEDVGDHRCRCTGCGRKGVKDLDREPVILHKKDCPHDDQDESERGTVDVSPCPGCGAPTTGDTCGRARCEGADEIDEAPL